MPEEDALIGAFAARSVAGHDSAKLSVQRLLREQALVDMAAQRPEPAGPRLPPIVHHDLITLVSESATALMAP